MRRKKAKHEPEAVLDPDSSSSDSESSLGETAELITDLEVEVLTDVEIAPLAEASADAEPLADDPDAELSPAFAFEPARLKSILESLLFAADRPLTPQDLRRLSGCSDAAAIRAGLDQLMVDYEARGLVLYDVAGGYQFRTHPANSEYVQRLVAGRPVRLSRAQLETLAIIAYRQPVTRPEIDEIRGVDSGSTIKVLLDRSLIRVLGKKEEPGRPLLYGTSKEFLEFFNLRELRDLPTLREFHELTEDSLREVEALDQAAREESAGGAPDGGAGGGASGEPSATDDPDATDEDERAAEVSN